jgi:hypothetical protein
MEEVELKTRKMILNKIQIENHTYEEKMCSASLIKEQMSAVDSMLEKGPVIYKYLQEKQQIY